MHSKLSNLTFFYKMAQIIYEFVPSSKIHKLYASLQNHVSENDQSKKISSGNKFLQLFHHSQIAQDQTHRSSISS